MISIVIPTITGREQWLDNTVRSLHGENREIIIVTDKPTCGEAWNIGIQESKGDHILLAADDIEPAVADWLHAAAYWTNKGYLPCARVLNTDGTLQSCGDWIVEMPTGTVCTFARIPFATRTQMEAIGPIITTHYFTDVWFSAVGLKRGYQTVVVREMCFYHHYAPQGRLDDRFTPDRLEYEKAIRQVA